MERIKDALEQAHKAREKALSEMTVNTTTPSPTEINDLIDARRIRERVPFNQMTHDEQQTLIANGAVIGYEPGARVFATGSHDEHIHYLLEGAVTIESDDSAPQTVYAYQEAALLPLDEAGTKTHTVAAVLPSRVFRIAQAHLRGPVPPVTVAPAPAAPPIPRELYAQTYSGEQLAQLVDALEADRKTLVPEPGAKVENTAPDEVRFGESTMAVGIDVGLPEILTSPTDPISASSGANLPSRDEIGDELTRFTRELEARFRRYVEQVRVQERQRAQLKIQAHMLKLKQAAETQLRAKVVTIRDRYQAAHVAKEKKLRDRYEHLIALANKMTRQKAAIYQARRQLEDKLRLAEKVHNELAQIGLTVTRQLNDLEAMIPDEGENLAE